MCDEYLYTNVCIYTRIYECIYECMYINIGYYMYMCKGILCKRNMYMLGKAEKCN